MLDGFGSVQSLEPGPQSRSLTWVSKNKLLASPLAASQNVRWEEAVIVTTIGIEPSLEIAYVHLLKYVLVIHYSDRV